MRKDDLYSPAQGIAAIRLAMEAAPDDAVRARVVEGILLRVPESDARHTAGVCLFLDAVRDLLGAVR